MKASNECIREIKNCERLKLQAYKCPAGILTIGWGHTKNVSPRQRITVAKAEELFEADMKEVYHSIDSRLTITRQGQYDALCSFIFNLGASKFYNSTLFKLIKAKARDKDIQAEFKKWVHADGRILDGLVTRRNWEAERWVS